MTMASHTNCPHVEAFQTLVPRYQLVVSWGSRRTQRGRKRQKLSHPSCATCNTTLTRPLACLSCKIITCWQNDHLLNHLTTASHPFGVDVNSGRIFCAECVDFIVHPGLDKLLFQVQLKEEERQSNKGALPKHIRDSFKHWQAGDRDKDALQNFRSIPCQARRGLVNLGQTCWMNVVLQVLLHNPLIRNYFLSDKHNNQSCKNEDGCTCCEMDKLFTQIYFDDPTPVGPTSFLGTFWKKNSTNSELGGYAQQDAHEFFLTMLNLIHGTSRGSTNVSCNCVVHSTFAGLLQSDVECRKCGFVSSTVDPAYDVSLELSGQGKESLLGCLARFTSSEKLAVEGYSCQKCKTSNGASKRMSIRKLPPVLSFQFKRFEINPTSTKKIDQPTSLPASLNMAPYTSTVMTRMVKEERPFDPAMCPVPSSVYEYELFAVINHQGQLSSGHYTNYARQGDQWYRFDDDKVTLSTLTQVLQSADTYMCFYAKKHLEYKPHTVPSYIRSREAEMEKEMRERKEKDKAREKEVEDELLATI